MPRRLQFRDFATTDGPVRLTVRTYGRGAIHLSPGIIRWADESRANASAVNRAIARHSRKVAGRTITKDVVTSFEWKNANDSAHATSEPCGRTFFSWFAFASEF